MRVVCRAVMGIFLVCLCVPELAAAQGYVVIDLGSLSPAAINTTGQVAGNYNNHAYRWSRAQGLEDLGVLPNGSSSGASSINDQGTVVGFADGPALGGYPGNVPHGALWKEGEGITDLGADDGLCGGGDLPTMRVALDVNTAGNTVGFTECWDADYGFLWTQNDGVTIILPNWGSRAYAINNRNQIAGWEGAYRFNGDGTAVFEDKGVVTALGTLGGAYSGAFDINDRGQVVGYADPDGGFAEPHAFLWTKASGMEDLGVLPGDSVSTAFGINRCGEVVGVSTASNAASWAQSLGLSDDFRALARQGVTSQPFVWQRTHVGGEVQMSAPTSVSSHPFIWTKAAGMQSLNALIPPKSGWVLTSVTGINNRGQIVGQGLRNGETHGFMLTPKQPN